MSAFFQRLIRMPWGKKKKHLVLVHLRVNNQTIQQLQIPCEARSGKAAKRDAEAFVREHLKIVAVESKIMTDAKN